METIFPNPQSSEQSPTSTSHTPLTNWNVTALVALITLLVGIALGYSARPMLDPAPAPTPVVIVVTPAPNTDANAAAALTPTTKRATLLDAVIAQTRHFKGNTNAPVTIIEFGDFQ
jgi:hypothetical protein